MNRKFVAALVIAVSAIFVMGAARYWNTANVNHWLQTVIESGSYTDGAYLWNQGTLTNGLEIENDGTTTSALVVDNDGTLTTGLVMEGTITTGIDLSGATLTSDIKLESSDTITNPDADTIKLSDKLCLENDECLDNGTNGQIEFGLAQIHDIRLEVSSAASWSAPYTCDATAEGAIIYADDSDDTQVAEICACLYTDGTGYAWTNVTDGTACDP